jgi:hypothetical protein
MKKGNGCGHVPSSPKGFTPPTHHRVRPGVLVKLSARLQAYYTDPGTILPSLNLANGSARQQRSERREACLIVLNVLIHYLDLVTLRVGIPKANGNMRGLTVDFIAEKAELKKRRAERAISDLVAAGVITVHAIAQRDEQGNYSGKGAIRTVTKKLFELFGLGNWLKYERDRAAAKRRKLRMRAMKRDLARRDIITRDLFKRTPAKPATDTPNRTEELTRLMKEHPELCIETLFTMLGRRPQTPGNHPA